MELVILSMVIIFILLFFLYNKEINYIKKNEREEEKEDNICAPTDFNPANGAPSMKRNMILKHIVEVNLSK